MKSLLPLLSLTLLGLGLFLLLSAFAGMVTTLLLNDARFMVLVFLSFPAVGVLAIADTVNQTISE